MYIYYRISYFLTQNKHIVYKPMSSYVWLLLIFDHPVQIHLGALTILNNAGWKFKRGVSMDSGEDLAHP